MDNKQLLENKYQVARLTKEAMEGIPYRLGEDNACKLGEVHSRIQSILTEVYGIKKLTVQNIVQEIYDLASANFPEPISTGELQQLFYMQVEVLADLLGVELKDE